MSDTIKAKYISVSGEVIYENAQIFSPSNLPPSVPILYPSQVVFKADGNYIFTEAANIIVALISNSTVKPRKAKGFHVKRIASIGVSYKNAFIVTNPYEAYGIPNVFGDSGIAIVCSDGTLLSTKEKWPLIEVGPNFDAVGADLRQQIDTMPLDKLCCEVRDLKSKINAIEKATIDSE